GSIWFGTINGLCHFNPKENEGNKQAPLLSITDVKLFYESILELNPELLRRGVQNKDLDLAYGDNRISFDFLGLNLRSPNRVMYRWKLEGLDKTWSPPSSDRSIMYSNLGSGSYRFLLIAANEDGVWSDDPLIFNFTVETPVWRRTWFIVVTILMILIILFLLYRITTNRIQRRAEEKQKQVLIEKNFLELEQKALRLQMNPHFIFNALNSIQSLIGTEKETEARYYLAKFSRLMRQILNNSRKSEITLEEEINTLENYLLIEQFCSGNSFEYFVETEDELETDFINIPPMLIQPFVENCIKHGFKRSTNNTNIIKISCEENSGLLIFTIEDNGIGREKSAEINMNSKETYHESTSMRVINQRLDLLNADNAYRSLEIVDLSDEENRPMGTRIIIRIPID
ncbi:MAG: histidine kinase, partial [Crocinitomicaceae bacterium]|nr:histidine kinase [Crocinitomicaceae bacterium]